MRSVPVTIVAELSCKIRSELSSKYLLLQLATFNNLENFENLYTNITKLHAMNNEYSVFRITSESRDVDDKLEIFTINMSQQDATFIFLGASLESKKYQFCFFFD